MSSEFPKQKPPLKDPAPEASEDFSFVTSASEGPREWTKEDLDSIETLLRHCVKLSNEADRQDPEASERIFDEIAARFLPGASELLTSHGLVYAWFREGLGKDRVARNVIRDFKRLGVTPEQGMSLFTSFSERLQEFLDQNASTP